MKNDTIAGEMIKKPFFDWIVTQRDNRQWNDSELASKAEISQSNLSLIMSGQRNITFDFCVGVAKAFRVRPELVLYRAGLLTEPAIKKDELNDDEVGLIQAYRNLPSEHQEALRNVATGLSARFGQQED